MPLLEGTGVSIKTLEAIAAGRPVVASPAGLRGLGASGDMAVATGSGKPSFGKPWADCIERLLASPEARLAWRDKMAGEIDVASLAAGFAGMAGRIVGMPPAGGRP